MDRVKINGKDRPICFGWNAYKEYEKLIGGSIFAFTNPKEFSAGNILSLVYVGLMYGAKKEKEDINFTIEDVGDWMDENEELAVEVIEVYIKSMPDPGKKK